MATDYNQQIKDLEQKIAGFGQIIQQGVPVAWGQNLGRQQSKVGEYENIVAQFKRGRNPIRPRENSAEQIARGIEVWGSALTSAQSVVSQTQRKINEYNEALKGAAPFEARIKALRIAQQDADDLAGRGAYADNPAASQLERQKERYLDSIRENPPANVESVIAGWDDKIRVALGKPQTGLRAGAAAPVPAPVVDYGPGDQVPSGIHLAADTKSTLPTKGLDAPPGGDAMVNRGGPGRQFIQPSTALSVEEQIAAQKKRTAGTAVPGTGSTAFDVGMEEQEDRQKALYGVNQYDEYGNIVTDPNMAQRSVPPKPDFRDFDERIDYNTAANAWNRAYGNQPGRGISLVYQTEPEYQRARAEAAQQGQVLPSSADAGKSWMFREDELDYFGNVTPIGEQYFNVPKAATTVPIATAAPVQQDVRPQGLTALDKLLGVSTVSAQGAPGEKPYWLQDMPGDSSSGIDNEGYVYKWNPSLGQWARTGMQAGKADQPPADVVDVDAQRYQLDGLLKQWRANPDMMNTDQFVNRIISMGLVKDRAEGNIWYNKLLEGGNLPWTGAGKQPPADQPSADQPSAVATEGGLPPRLPGETELEYRKRITSAYPQTRKGDPGPGPERKGTDPGQLGGIVQAGVVEPWQQSQIDQARNYLANNTKPDPKYRPTSQADFHRQQDLIEAWERAQRIVGTYGTTDVPIVTAEDIATGRTGGGKAGFTENLTNRYMEGMVGTGIEDFPALYKEAENYYFALAVADISQGKPKQDLNSPQYGEQKLQAQNDAFTMARSIRNEALAKQARGEAAATKMKPALTFSTPTTGGPRPTRSDFTREQFEEPEAEYQAALQKWETQPKGGVQSGLGYNAKTIRGNLDNLPPDDDRRAALTELLAMYEEFDASMGRTITAADANLELQKLSQGFQTKERMLREKLSSEERMADQQIQADITKWQQKQTDFAKKLEANIAQAQMTGYWGPNQGTETLELTRLEFERDEATLASAFRRETERLSFQIEQQRAVGEATREERMLAVEQRQTEQEAREWKIEDQRWTNEQKRLDAVLTGFLGEQPTIEREEFALAKSLQRATITGLFGEDNEQTMAFKSQKFQESLTEERMKNQARLEEIKLQMNENDNETKLAIADKQVAIEQGKLDDAVKARRVQVKLEADNLNFKKTQMRFEAIQTLTNPKTLLILQRTGMLSTLERVLGIQLDMPTFPDLLPPGQTIPTQQYLNMASPTDRELIMTEASLRSGFSDMDVRSVLQRQMPGGLGVSIGYRGEGR